MSKVDIDKFLISIMKMTPITSETEYLIQESLKKQGLRFDGEDLVEIEPFKLEEGKWYVFTHASLHYDTMNGEVTFKQGKPYKAIGESTLLGDGGVYCFRGQEDMLKKLRLATEEEISYMQKPQSNAVDTLLDEIDIDDMAEKLRRETEKWEFNHYVTLGEIAETYYRKGLEDMLQAIRKKG